MHWGHHPRSRLPRDGGAWVSWLSSVTLRTSWRAVLRRLSRDTQRTNIVYEGCFGCLSVRQSDVHPSPNLTVSVCVQGFKAAKALAAENKRHRVLLVCCELCSLHNQMDDRSDNLVAAVRFLQRC
jgi:hypothetical protein